MTYPPENHPRTIEAARSLTGTVVVTGAAGFIGSNLTAALLRINPALRVLAIDDLRAASYANITEACDRYETGPFSGSLITDSTDDLRWHKLFKRERPAAVFHLAAITDTTVTDEGEMIAANAHGFRDLLHAAHRARVPLVYASSAATYGTPPEAHDHTPFATESAGRPENVYGFSKWLMENEHRAFDSGVTGVPLAGWEKSRLPASLKDGGAPHAVGLRYFNVFGPGEARKQHMSSMAYQLAVRMLNGDNPRLFEHGEQQRDQVSVFDVVDCTIAAAHPEATPGIYNLGSGTPTSFNDVATAVREGLGFSESDRPIEYFPIPDHIRRFYQSFTLADMTRTAESLHWTPSHAPEQALREYAEHLRATHRGEAAPTPA